MVLEGATQFRAQVKNLMAQHKLLLADLSGVDFVDSSGLGSVLGTYISALSGGCTLKLINVHPRVRDLLNIAHLNTVFDDRHQ
jgi:anti-anti-sigma factor